MNLTSLFVRALALASIAVLCGTVRADESRTPLQTVQRMHDALREADVAKAESVLDEHYAGLSLNGPLDTRDVFVETRDKALSTLRTLKPGSWDVHILDSNVRIDPNGMAHVWARYVFYFDGKPNHCGYESYVLFRRSGEWKIVEFADTDTALHGADAAQVCPQSTLMPKHGS